MSEITKTYSVHGMTCDHCRAAVKIEVSALAGVSSAEIEPDGDLLEVRSEGVSDEAVQTAVEAAGYGLAGER